MSKIRHFRDYEGKVQEFVNLREATVVCSGNSLGYSVVKPGETFHRRLGVALAEKMLAENPITFPFKVEGMHTDELKMLVNVCINIKRKRDYKGNLHTIFVV